MGSANTQLVQRVIQYFESEAALSASMHASLRSELLSALRQHEALRQPIAELLSALDWQRSDDQALLSKIACRDQSPFLRQWAQDQILDQEQLIPLVACERDQKLRLRLVRRIEDSPTLMRVASEDHDTKIRKFALEKLELDQQQLASLYFEDVDASLRRLILPGLTDDAILSALTEADAELAIDEDVQLRAAELSKERTRREKELESSRRARAADQERARAAEVATEELFEAASRGEAWRAIRAIEAGADVNAKREGGWAPLFAAIEHSHIARYQEVVVLLLDKGADVNIRITSGSFEGWTPLTMARSGHHIPGRVGDLIEARGGRS